MVSNCVYKEKTVRVSGYSLVCAVLLIGSWTSSQADSDSAHDATTMAGQAFDREAWIRENPLRAVPRVDLERLLGWGSGEARGSVGEFPLYLDPGVPVDTHEKCKYQRMYTRRKPVLSEFMLAVALCPAGEHSLDMDAMGHVLETFYVGIGQDPGFGKLNDEYP